MRLLYCITVTVALSLFTFGVRAEVSLGDSLTGAAKQAYESARVLMMNRDYAGAVTQYRRAYDVSKDPRLLFNMAVAEKEQRHYARMQALLLRYERESGASMSAEDRAAAENALGAIKNLVVTLTVTSNESGATVLVDGEEAGTTPFPPIVVDLGRHTVAAKKDGFDTYEATIDAAGGTSAEVTATLARRARVGRLLVAPEAGATVWIDGKAVGTGRSEVTLAPGPHEVRVTAPGKVPYTSEVDLRDGERRTVQVTLEAQRGKPLWPWIVGGAALVAGAAVGGYFLFKPQDTTAGPAPVGTLGTVYISGGAR